MLRFLAAAVLALAVSAPLAAQDAPKIAMTDRMLATGFDKHILPRFKFKHRIALDAVSAADAADMALVLGGTEGARVFATVEGEAVRLVTLSEGAGVADAAGTLRKWLTSTPGKAAIEAFAPEGAALFSTEVKQEAVVTQTVVEGDIALGSNLAIRHCGRCHVVDERNRMGGIGSTPSFAALRGRGNWSDVFLAYWTQNPHPSFTHVKGLTEPFSADRPTHVQPVELTVQEIEAITAFVGTLTPLDLGRPIQSQ